MFEDLEPFVEVELEVCLRCRPEIAASPAAPLAMRDRAADGAAGREEEEVDVRIYLRDDAKLGVELGVEGFEWDVGAETTVFPFVAEGVWR